MALNFTITNQVQYEECLMWVSDMYKDIYGTRPRCYDFESMSYKELADFVNDLDAEGKRLEKQNNN